MNKNRSMALISLISIAFVLLTFNFARVVVPSTEAYTTATAMAERKAILQTERAQARGTQLALSTMMAASGLTQDLQAIQNQHNLLATSEAAKATDLWELYLLQQTAQASFPLTVASPSHYASPTSTQTPIPNQVLQNAFEEIDKQFNNSIRGNFAFNKPSKMNRGETTEIKLMLNPSLPESNLGAQLAEQAGFVTSTAEHNVLISPNGESVTIETGQVEITPRMKAVLLPQDPKAFTVTEKHDNAEQVVSSFETTTWRWSVTAKKEGSQTLELVIYQLVKYDGKEFWHEVETYKANIVVEVTLGDRVKSLDWYWIAGFIVTLVGAIIGIWKWLDERKKKPGVIQVKIVDERKSPPKRKKK